LARWALMRDRTGDDAFEGAEAAVGAACGGGDAGASAPPSPSSLPICALRRAINGDPWGSGSLARWALMRDRTGDDVFRGSGLPAGWKLDGTSTPALSLLFSRLMRARKGDGPAPPGLPFWPASRSWSTRERSRPLAEAASAPSGPSAPGAGAGAPPAAPELAPSTARCQRPLALLTSPPSAPALAFCPAMPKSRPRLGRPERGVGARSTLCMDTASLAAKAVSSMEAYLV